MSFIAKHIANSDERIVYVARLHWVYIFYGLSWLTVFCIIGTGMDYLLWHYSPIGITFKNQEIAGINLGNPAHWFLWMMLFTGGMLFLVYFFRYLASEIALTNRRIIYKTGLFFVEVEEIDLEEIKAEKIHHGVLGRFLGYGHLNLDSRFVGDIHLPTIKRPYKFLQALHRTRGRNRDSLLSGSNV